MPDFIKAISSSSSLLLFSDLCSGPSVVPFLFTTCTTGTGLSGLGGLATFCFETGAGAELLPTFSSKVSVGSTFIATLSVT